MKGEYDEIELLIQLKLDNAEAFDSIYRHYRSRVLAFSYKLTKSSEIAEDIVQDVFSTIWERRRQIDPSLSFQAYVKKIAFNLIISYFRRVKRNKAMLQKLYADMQSFQQNESYVVDKDQVALYRKAINALPLQKKTAYLLSRDECLSYERIAAEMGISKNTVRNHMTEAIRLIRQYISRNRLVIVMLFLALAKNKY